MSKRFFSLLPLLLVLSCCQSTHRASTPHPIVRQTANAIAIPFSGGWLTLQAHGERIIHVVFAKEPFPFDQKSLDLLPDGETQPGWKILGDKVVVSTASIRANVDLSTAQITFTDATGYVIMKENSRAMMPIALAGQQTFHVQQTWMANKDESLYGLGQNQLGLTDIKGYDLDLWQHNGTITIPFFLSTHGYGILWDNPSYTRFGDLRPWAEIPSENLLDHAWNVSYFSDNNLSKLIATRNEDAIAIEERPDINGHPTARTDTPIDSLAENQGGARWQTTLVAPVSGDYQFLTYSNGGTKLWIDGKLLINHWRQNWLPWYDVARVSLRANHHYKIQIEWSREQGSVLQLRWKMPGELNATSLWSDVGSKVDYYFIGGNSDDEIIAGYRQLTGPAPMMPIWAFGLWQSRQRYETAQQSLDVVNGFRDRQIPFDNIVQDWQYWPKDAWGSHQFDPKRFPDPNAWIREIHALHARLMISVWGKFYTGTKNFDAMQARGFLYQPNLQQHIIDWLGYAYTFFDAFNPAARDLFWEQVKPALFDRGVDAWWLDATEPDIAPTPTLDAQMDLMNPTALGPARKVLNAYSIMMAKTFHDHQLKDSPNQRIFILTRNAFLSQQRNAAAVWSGDTTCTWTAMRKQIAAGISYCMSGLPYWTMDIGGFTPPAKFSADNFDPKDFAEWCELSTRWFEFGTFCPLLRVHGEGHVREMWQFGGEHSPAYAAQLKFDRLRYRLLPYIYSLAGDITQNDGTMMRGLAMDFPTDAKARQITTEFMFGPAFLVAPVTEYGARSWNVYLPQIAGTQRVPGQGRVAPRLSGGWYNFWTGQFFGDDRTIKAPAPLDAMPLFIRAGSIIPLGPELQYTAEKPSEPITLLVYTGRDATFSIYEDDGVTNAYEQGQFTRIPISWNQKSRQLSIGNRTGSFGSMLKERTFRVVFISPENPIPFSFSPCITKTIHYDGRAVAVTASNLN